MDLELTFRASLVHNGRFGKIKVQVKIMSIRYVSRYCCIPFVFWNGWIAPFIWAFLSVDQNLT